MRIAWTKLALKDLDQLWDYIAEDKPSAAEGILQKIEEAVLSLRSYPNLGRPGRVKGTRELVIIGTPYLVPYRVRKNRLEILAVIHGSRRWPQNFLISES